MTQADKARALLQRHLAPPILVLPNAWDAASARVFETAGFPAIATTSAGVAWARGYPDGAYIPPGEMIAVIARIAASVDVPVTADIEHGYGGTIGEVVRTVEQVIEAGAVGINLEDALPGVRGTLEAVGLQAEKIRAIRDLADAVKVPLVVNARTDVYLDAIGEPATRLEATVRRARAYRAAGADCIFVPGVRDGETIGRLVAEIGGPINVLAGQGIPPAAELQRLGVARVSVGSGPMRAVLGRLQQMAASLHDEGRFELVTEGPTHSAINELMAEPARRLAARRG
ncbi:MAG TPA: isocitrate lyase/phosphoenolpyruvate mutase family protein [Vicinamibacterales bacterium]|jgi:2-methylisocitrate lyase-like PEP mutase family enzyme